MFEERPQNKKRSIISIKSLLEFITLFGLGFFGWKLFDLIHLPIANILGPVVLIGILRVLNIPLIFSPKYLSIIIQVAMGYIIGSKITRDRAKVFKTMIIPVVVIIIWTISVVFLLSYILMRLTSLDAYTAILASSMGGLAEMTLLSIIVGAETSVVAIIHTIRVLSTLAFFPVLANKFESDSSNKSLNKTVDIDFTNNVPLDRHVKNIDNKKKFSIKICTHNILSFKIALKTWGKTFLILCLATISGFGISNLGVPAGPMVGSMITVSAISFVGINVKPFSSVITNLLFVGVGIMIADNISSQTVEMIMSGRFVLIILISTFFIFLSSFSVALLIYKITGWDKLTCFLSTAPGGFTVLASLAIKYKKDIFVVSILHLGRLIIIKILIPIIFTLIM